MRRSEQEAQRRRAPCEAELRACIVCVCLCRVYDQRRRAPCVRVRVCACVYVVMRSGSEDAGRQREGRDGRTRPDSLLQLCSSRRLRAPLGGSS